MPAYIISDATFRDPAALEIYRTRAVASIAQRGGRFLVRSGATEILEGEWKPRSIVIVEFLSMDAACAWYRSAEYAEALEVRDRARSRSLILVEGVAATAR